MTAVAERTLELRGRASSMSDVPRVVGAGLLAGTVVVERVFAIPGLGNIFIQAVLNRDEPLILGVVAFLSILIMVFNLIVDISYGYLDPRIRYE